MRKATNPAFLKLGRVAREIGINAATIEANRDDFFDTIRLGHQKYVRAADFHSWLDRHSSKQSTQNGPQLPRAAL